jgi:hypothetical protein
MWWQQFITVLGGGALCLAAVAWLARSIVAHVLARDVDAHKSKLAAASAVEIERLKSDLQKTAFEHQVTFGKLHAERAEIIKNLHTRLISLKKAAVGYGSSVGDENPEVGKKRMNELRDAIGTLLDAMERDRIFLSVALSEKIENLAKKILIPVIKFLHPGSPSKESWTDVWSTAESDIQKIQLDLENEFRSILGVK